MYTKFESLSDEKRKRIINSAFNEFSNKQFKEASTDDIAKNAEISKGALFQYFGTKRQLYLYIYNYGYDILINEFWGQVDLSDNDLFERLKGVFAIKMNIYGKHPNLFQFILNAYTRETDKEIKQMTNKEFESQTAQAYANLYANIDYSLFNPTFDPSHIVSIIVWSMEGYANTELAKLKNQDMSTDIFEHWIQELEQYIVTLKKAFYKEEN